MVYVHSGVLFSPKEKMILFSEKWIELRSWYKEKPDSEKQIPRFLSSTLYSYTNHICIVHDYRCGTMGVLMGI